MTPDFRYRQPLQDESGHVPSLLQELTFLLRCPVTGEELAWSDSSLVSRKSSRRYAITDGIPQLFAFEQQPIGDDVTEIVKTFYEKTPFPNYDDFDSRESLASKAEKSVFAAMLKEQLPQDALVLDAGCGTGQLTNYLGMSWKSQVIGGDICLNSLRLAKVFRDRFSIRNAAFVQMNLFRLPFCRDAFDVIITNGVLHHTGDPRRAFVELLRRLKPGGVILVGLYNSYGRLPTLWRRQIFEWFGSRAYFLDPRLLKKGMAAGRWNAWFADQYEHPQESRHSQDEVLRWFDENKVDFLSGIPSPDGRDLHADDNLFVPHSRGTTLDRFAVQMGLLLQGGKDGGLFIMAGRKRG